MHLPLRIKIAYAGHLPRAIAVDANDFGLSPEIEVAGLERDRDHGIERGRFGVDMAAIKVAVAAVNTSGPLRDPRIKRSRRPIGLRQNAGGSLIRMVSELRACFSE